MTHVTEEEKLLLEFIVASLTAYRYYSVPVVEGGAAHEVVTEVFLHLVYLEVVLLSYVATVF